MRVCTCTDLLKIYLRGLYWRCIIYSNRCLYTLYCVCTYIVNDYIYTLDHQLIYTHVCIIVYTIYLLGYSCSSTTKTQKRGVLLLKHHVVKLFSLYFFFFSFPEYKLPANPFATWTMWHEVPWVNSRGLYTDVYDRFQTRARSSYFNFYILFISVCMYVCIVCLFVILYSTYRNLSCSTCWDSVDVCLHDTFHIGLKMRKIIYIIYWSMKWICRK